MIQKCVVLGAGAWGTALAVALCRAHQNVVLIPKFEKEEQSLRENRENIEWLPGIKLPPSLQIGSYFDDVEKCSPFLQKADIIFWAIPVQFSINAALHLQKHISDQCPIIICSKGFVICESTHEGTFLSQELQKILKNPLGYLSGPNFAREVALNTYTAAVIASEDLALAEKVAKSIQSNRFKIYLSQDIISLQVSGALKNVLALACGIITGLNLGQNTRAFILSLGFSEICLIGQKLGGKTKTLLGLGGLGDMTLTCFSEKSRNTAFGIRIGKGEKAEDIIKEKGSIVEGYFTAKSAYFMARKLNLKTPILDMVYNILYHQIAPLAAIQNTLHVSENINIENEELI